MKYPTQSVNGIGREEVKGAGECDDDAEAEGEEGFSCNHGGRVAGRG
jgi:hypothetical protein